MKKTKLFAKIVYFLFTFSIGILLALFLPYILFLDSGDIVNTMGDMLLQKKYVDAMKIPGGYFDSEPVVLHNFDDGGSLVLFRSATLVESENSTEQKPVGDKLAFSYSGFLVATKTYNVDAVENNKAHLVLTDKNGNHDISILDFDLSDDGKADTCATYYKKGFIYLSFESPKYDGLTSLTLIDKDGKVFAEVGFGKSLGFSDSFFADVQPVIQKFNEYVDEYARDNSQANNETLSKMEKELDSLQETFLAKNKNYTRSAYVMDEAVIKSKSDRKAAVIVVVYFVCVYVIADFLLGYHYIIRFVRWLLVKVFKVKLKPRKVKNEDAFGHDYYCKVTFVLDTSAVENFSQSLSVHYSNQTEEVTFVFLKEQSYSATQRVKAGEYVNLHIDVDGKYVLQGVPETLVVEGFQKGYKIKIIKREE